jgi:RNA-directed DNA polymerase
VLTLVRQRLKSVVLEKGRWAAAGGGSPARGIHLLANISLCFAFDLWAHQWRNRHARGDVIIVRWADDFVAGVDIQRA